MNTFFNRLQPTMSPRIALVSGIGAFVAIAFVSILSQFVDEQLLMAPFGASCVLLFSVSQSPLSQPANVIGGHLLSAVVGLVMVSFFPDSGFAAAIAVGLAVGLMAAFRITHPPAGANPLVIFAFDPGWHFLLFPVLTGSIALVLVACAFHRLTGTEYPNAK